MPTFLKLQRLVFASSCSLYSYLYINEATLSICWMRFELVVLEYEKECVKMEYKIL